MDQQRGGCCITAYAGCPYDMSKVDRIMLRFRPIAPKPDSTDGSVPGGRNSGCAAPEYVGERVKTGRGKRRHGVIGDGCSSTTVSRRSNCGRRRKSSPENTDSAGSVTGGGKDVKILPLLPEEPDVKGSPVIALGRSYPSWLSLGNEVKGGGGIVNQAADRSGLEDLEAGMGRQVVAAAARSWVRVERVTDTWMAAGWYDSGGIGRTDEEMVMNLHLDTCPGFITDGLNRVRWANAAYKRMEAAEEVAASAASGCVVLDQGVALPVGCEGFTCKVRVFTCGKENKSAKTVPCDVWRMGCGWFAWRLDTAAALCLGWSLA
ncbi:hypothetical protein OROHE_007802 [Orobanche hederae]